MRRRIALVGVALALVGGVLVSPAGAGGEDDGDESVSSANEQVQRRAGLELLTLLPESYDAGCRIQTDDDVAADPLLLPLVSRVQAFLVCPTDVAAHTLYITKLDGEDAVNSLYDSYTPGGLDSDIPGCETDDTWGDGRGRYKCYVTVGGQSAVIWTLPEENTVFGVFSNDPMSALEEWWASEAPPIDDPPEPDEIVSDDEWTDNSRLLRKSVPKGLRDTCAVPPIEAEALGGLYRNRLYLRTVLFCEAGGGVTTYYFADFQTRASAQAYLDAHEFQVDEEVPRVESESADCEGTGTWSRRSTGRSAGDYLCYFADDGAVFIIWTDRRQGIAVVAAREDGDADKLLQFYADEAGPLPNPALSG